MFRMLVTDIDDTILPHNAEIPEVNREVLKRLHAKGVVIVFASGRADSSIQSVAARILPPADDEYYIAFNGARVVTAASREIVTSHYVPATAVEQIVEYTRSAGLHVQGYVDDTFVFELGRGARKQFGADIRAAAEAYSASTGQTFRISQNLNAELSLGTPKLLIIGDHEELLPHRAQLNELGAGSYRAMFSKPNYLEIVAAKVSKGAALRELAARLGIAVEETLALGDGDNDAEMLDAAGTGVAVANAREQAKATADITLDSHAVDGVMPEVERRFFAA